MSTAVLAMQSLGTQRHFEADFNMSSETAPGYEGWTPCEDRVQASMAMPDYTGFPSDSLSSLQSNFQQLDTTNRDSHGTALKRPFTEIDAQNNQNARYRSFSTSLYSSPAMFTASNVNTTAYDPVTVSPLDTRFDADQTSSSSGNKFVFDDQMYRASSSNLTSFIDNPDDNDPSSAKRRCDSLQSNNGAYSPKIPQTQVGRRRGSEYAEPGSARAVYLEKNRKAASKCRSKQKQQQEDLVETARDVERRNKILKAEVAILKSGMQDLMELVGQHTQCSDTRLRLYLEREADRLAMGSQKNSLSSVSPITGSPYSGTGSVSKISSPAEV